MIILKTASFKRATRLLTRSLCSAPLAHSLHFAPLHFALLHFTPLRFALLTHLLALRRSAHSFAHSWERLIPWCSGEKTTSALWCQTFPQVSKRVSGAARSEQASERSEVERSGAEQSERASEQSAAERTSGPFKTTPFSAKSIIVKSLFGHGRSVINRLL